MRMGAPDRAESPGLPTDPDQASAAVLASVSLPRTLPSDLVPVPVSEGNPTCTLGHDFPRRRSPGFPVLWPAAARSPLLGGGHRHFRRRC